MTKYIIKLEYGTNILTLGTCGKDKLIDEYIEILKEKGYIHNKDGNYIDFRKTPNDIRDAKASLIVVEAAQWYLPISNVQSYNSNMVQELLREANL